MVWNCQRATNSKFHKVMKEYMSGFDPDLVILVETRVSGYQANCTIRSIGLANSYRVETKGFSSRIWVLWKSSGQVNVEVNASRFVHLKVKFPGLTD